MIFLFFLACDLDSSSSTCSAYSQNSSDYGYCLYKHAERIESITEIEEYCSHAGKWQQDCRQSWVQSKIDRYSLEELIGICQQNTDCAFEVLDERPSEDLLIQIERCEAYAYRYFPECVSHATWRWYYTDPSIKEMQRVSKANLRSASFHVAEMIAARVQCSNVGSCEDAGRYAQQCKQNTGKFKEKSQCPNQRHLFEKKAAQRRERTNQ